MTARQLHLTALACAAALSIAALVWLLAPRSPRPTAPAPPTAPSPSATPLPGPSSLPPETGREGAPITPEVTTIRGDDAFRLHVFTISLAAARFRVIDLAMSRDLGGTLAKSGASLVVNGGFFDPADRPEGLVISEGKEISARSDALGGGVFTIAGDKAALHAAEGFVPPEGVSFAVQARPRLVVEGKRVIGRDDGKEAARTALCARDGGRTIEVVIARGEAWGAGPTLALLADMLASRGCEAALNLDGGPSTGAAWREAGGARDLPARGPLRHAIAIWAAD